MTAPFATRVAAVVTSLFIVAGCGLLTGCDSSRPTTAPPPDVKDALSDLGDLLRLLSAQNQRPPAKPADIDQYEPTAPHAAAAVQKMEIVYVWGSGITPGGTAVIAYDAKAEASGGYVLLQEGTVKKMSASEFAAAPKAAKK